MKKVGVIVPELLTHIGRTPVTLSYPFVKVEAPEGFRGTPRFKPEKCTGCKLCMKDCTAEAIEIEMEKIEIKEEPRPEPKEGEATAEGGEAKKFKRKCRMTLYLDRCVHCARCVEVCNRDALYMDREFEIANFNRAAFKIVME